MESNQVYPDRAFSKLGWINLPTYDEDGKLIAKLHYRSHKLLGGQTAKYLGDYRVKPKGTFEAWRDMVVKDIVGNTALELVLVTSLSAV